MYILLMEEATQFYVLHIGAPKKDINMEAVYLIPRNYRLKKGREALELIC